MVIARLLGQPLHDPPEEIFSGLRPHEHEGVRDLTLSGTRMAHAAFACQGDIRGAPEAIRVAAEHGVRVLQTFNVQVNIQSTVDCQIGIPYCINTLDVQIIAIVSVQELREVLLDEIAVVLVSVESVLPTWQALLPGLAPVLESCWKLVIFPGLMYDLGDRMHGHTCTAICFSAQGRSACPKSFTVLCSAYTAANESTAKLDASNAQKKSGDKHQGGVPLQIV
mmetsp:Transcript_5629/g.9409  ORF Transcript_5629/g.9409 Transcript_5629/m.9409 type:complete len:223 (-) Transcript_5629:38-706(-)